MHSGTLFLERDGDRPPDARCAAGHENSESRLNHDVASVTGFREESRDPGQKRHKTTRRQWGTAILIRWRWTVNT